MGGVSYWSVRERLRVERGPASGYRCVECGAAARDWSYDGTDPAERTDPARGYRYSLDLGRYRPRCRSCHRRAARPREVGVLDVAEAARLYEAGVSGAGISAVLGTSRPTVLRRLRAHGVTIRHAGRRPRRPYEERSGAVI